MKKILIIIGSALVIISISLVFFLFCKLWLETKTTNIETLTNQNSFSSDQTLAESTLYIFFQKLFERQYEVASQLYRGDYDQLHDWNPIIDKDNFSALWKNGCEGNGLNCLLVDSIVSAQETFKDEYTFSVRFLLPNGDIFSQGPCCGADPNGQTQTDFSIRVKKIDNQFFVVDLPPYSP